FLLQGEASWHVPWHWATATHGPSRVLPTCFHVAGQEPWSASCVERSWPSHRRKAGAANPLHSGVERMNQRTWSTFQTLAFCLLGAACGGDSGSDPDADTGLPDAGIQACA